jgi:hypothetical protein
MATPRAQIRPISLWWVAGGALVVVLGIWLSTWWLLAQAHGLHGAAQAAACMDALKTGLSVGAGIGGAVAVTVALRRQWLAERDQAHREDMDHQAQLRNERVAAASGRDAVERRVADLYVRAVDQLGSRKSVVRLGAMHALEMDRPGNFGGLCLPNKTMLPVLRAACNSFPRILSGECSRSLSAAARCCTRPPNPRSRK